MFNTFIAEDVGIVSVIDVEAMEVTDVYFLCFRRHLFGNCGDKVSEGFEGDRKGWGESMMSREFDVGSLSRAIDFASIGSESMPKKVCSFFFVTPTLICHSFGAAENWSGHFEEKHVSKLINFKTGKSVSNPIVF